MTEREKLEKAIKHFKCIGENAVVVLDSRFGTHEGESDILYRNQKMYAELAIEALEKQIAQKPEVEIRSYLNHNRDFAKDYRCPTCKELIGLEYPRGYAVRRIQTYCDVCGQKIDWEDMK